MKMKTGERWKLRHEKDENEGRKGMKTKAGEGWR